MKLPTFEEAHATVRKLAEDFEANKGHFLSPAYQESEVRTDFINKFLIALGWDVNHDWQKNPFQQEVKVERGVSMGGSQRRADYAFYIAPNFRKDDVRFFVEAKKPFGDIATPDNCFQTVRYGWNAGTPVAVLTDFEQFQILDCRYKPHIDTARGQVVRKYHYSEYNNPEKFAEIFHLFSRDAVAGGSLEEFAETFPKKRGKAGVAGLHKAGTDKLNDSFLADLDEYRDTLARAFKNSNPDLDGATLTEITQRTIDRLVFIRFLEDKLIHPDNLVANFGRKGTAWQDFVAASRKLDGIYNGIVFKQHVILDGPAFKVDDEVFAEICRKLSDRHTSYLFDYVPIHILGSIYEQFLGKVIVTTDKRARVEEKPEVRKAGGVYYTPEYIVRYIVENTVGLLIAGKTPAQIAEMRFADIACGSGSFLLGMLDLLLRYHRDWFNANPDRAKKAGCVQREDGVWHLTLKQRREILLNNIYGVDIDRQAVEVAQLSLYLKLLEEETIGTTREYQLEFHETLLPPLNKNIVCGNSLIGRGPSTHELFEQTAEEEEKELNPMDFEDRFPHIFRRRTSSGELRETPATPLDYTMPGVALHGAYSYKKMKGVKPAMRPVLLESELEGGFDAIVGNPPYRMLQPHNTNAQTLAYLREHYVAAEFKIEMFHLFLQRAVSLVRQGGCQSFIVPTTVLNNVYAESLRRWLLGRCCIEQVCVARGRVFADADVHTSVLVFRLETDAGKRDNQMVRTTAELGQQFAANPRFSAQTKQDTFSKLPGCVWNILVNEENKGLIARLTSAYQPLKKLAAINRGLITGDREKFFATERTTKDHVPIIAGSDVQRYLTKPPGEFVLFQRPKTAGGCWDAEVHFAPHKLVVRQICEKPTASIVRSPLAVTGNIFTARGTSLESELYLLGIINSRLMEFFWKTMFADFKDSFPQITIFSLEQLPIRVLDISKPADKVQHERMIALVEQMLATQKQLAAAQSDADKDFYGHKCEGLDRQIDALVYDLYALTPDKIKIVEGMEK